MSDLPPAPADEPRPPYSQPARWRDTVPPGATQKEWEAAYYGRQPERTGILSIGRGWLLGVLLVVVVVVLVLVVVATR